MVRHENKNFHTRDAFVSQDVAKTNMDTAREASERTVLEGRRSGETEERHGRPRKGAIAFFAYALSTWKYHNGDRRASEWSFMQPPVWTGGTRVRMRVRSFVWHPPPPLPSTPRERVIDLLDTRYVGYRYGCYRRSRVRDTTRTLRRAAATATLGKYEWHI